MAEERSSSRSYITVVGCEKQIHSIISAEIPDKETNPHLYEIVLANMIHGPCGKINPQCPCISNGDCSKQFPKAFTPETVSAGDGYPLYRRRGSHTGVKRLREKKLLSTINVSSLIPRIFAKCLNAEVCNSIRAIKYVIKYVNKGSDISNGDCSKQFPKAFTPLLNSLKFSQFGQIPFPSHSHSKR